jgi:Helix-turn-helix domain
MDKDEMKKWLRVEGSIDIQMPNEIFDDLNQMEFKSWKHKAFAYSYYYLITYIYRNALYGINPEDYSQEKILSSLVSSYRKLMYITKKNGVLDTAGYTETTTDYPIAVYMDNDIIEFALIKNLRKEIPKLRIEHSPRLSIKVPLKAFKRFEGEDLTGTFYDFQNTHLIKIGDFINIISNEKLGYVGLYLYAYIKTMANRYGGSLNMTNKRLADHIGCNERTVIKHLKELKKMGYINSKRNMRNKDSCIGMMHME